MIAKKVKHAQKSGHEKQGPFGYNFKPVPFNHLAEGRTREGFFIAKGIKTQLLEKKDLKGTKKKVVAVGNPNNGPASWLKHPIYLS
jgi:hypothetical protein